MRFRSPNAEATGAAAAALAACVDARGLVLALVGPLGAGKTVFVKGLAGGLGIDPARVTSPTFVVASEYPVAPGAAPSRLAHVDLYRLSSAAELEATGFLDLLEPGVLVAVEWADRIPQAIPAERLELRIQRGAGDAPRMLQARASGAAAAEVLACWREALAALPEVELELPESRWD